MSKARCAVVMAISLSAMPVHSQGTFTSTREIKVEPGSWVAAQPIVVPEVPTGVPAGSAGCLVIGQHLDGTGATSKPRVMQGAFSQDVSREAQQAFIAKALATSSQWRFRFVPPTAVPMAVKRDLEASDAPEWAFHRVIVGFAPSTPDVAPSPVLDADNQDARVAPRCRLATLADWGGQHAVAVEAARARSRDPVLVDKHSPAGSYWVSVGTMTPARFPEAAIRGGVDACVIVGFLIAVDGVPSEFRIMEARTVAPRPIRKAFEDSVLGAASTWRFAPGPDNLKRLPEFRQVPVRFESGRVPQRSECHAVDLSADATASRR